MSIVEYTMSRISQKSKRSSVVSSPFGSRNTLNLKSSQKSKSSKSSKISQKSKSSVDLLNFLITEAHAARVNRPVVKNRKKRKFFSKK